MGDRDHEIPQSGSVAGSRIEIRFPSPPPSRVEMGYTWHPEIIKSPIEVLLACRSHVESALEASRDYDSLI